MITRHYELWCSEGRCRVLSVDNLLMPTPALLYLHHTPPKHAAELIPIIAEALSYVGGELISVYAHPNKYYNVWCFTTESDK